MTLLLFGCCFSQHSDGFNLTCSCSNLKSFTCKYLTSLIQMIYTNCQLALGVSVFHGKARSRCDQKSVKTKGHDAYRFAQKFRFADSTRSTAAVYVVTHLASPIFLSVSSCIFLHTWSWWVCDATLPSPCPCPMR